MRGLHPLDHPVAFRLVTLGFGHVVLHAAAGPQVVHRECGRVHGWPPPALELAWVRPELPDALRRGLELRVQCHRQRLGILANGGHGHRSASSGCVLMSAAMRSTRPRHSVSYWSRSRRATRSPSRFVRTILRRPLRSFVMRPARSRIAMCFWTAAKLMA